MVMGQLSVTRYYKNNFRRVGPIIIAVLLSTFLLSLIHIFLNGVIDSINNYEVGFFERYSIITSMDDRGIDKRVIDNLGMIDDIERIIPVRREFTGVDPFLGVTTYSNIFLVEEKDVDETLLGLNLRVIEGRNPIFSEEIGLHWQLARHKGLSLGDEIGNMVNELEELPGRYKVVALLDGPIIASIGVIGEETLLNNAIVFPKDGTLEEINEFIYYMLPTNLYLQDIEGMNYFFANTEDTFFILLSIIKTLILLVLTITIANISYIHFEQRKREFAILSAIGYRRKTILSKVIKEGLFINLTAYIMGIILTLLFGSGINIIFLAEMGEGLDVWSINAFLNTLIIPLVVFISTLVSALRLFKSMDKISVIKGQ